MFKKIAYSLLPAFPLVLFAFSTGPPIKRTGAPVDGGQNCSVCHSTFAPANSDPSGSVSIDASAYMPGVTQIVKVTVKHPLAVRWGFQITARLASDPGKQAGTFAPNDTVRVRCDSNPAHDAPCNGALEFADHNDAPFTAQGAGFTFQVAWTPPGRNVGDIVFYAAGNAANGDRNLTGDRIYTTTTTISPGKCDLPGKPAITAVVNGASFQPTIASNTIVTIFGQNFAGAGDKRLAGAADIVQNDFPQQLACLAVEIDGKRSPVIYVQRDQINVEAPATASQGPVTVKVILNPDQDNQSSSDTATAQVLASSPAFFTFNGKSVAAQFAHTADPVADSSIVPGGKPAKPGDMVTLYGTGFGATEPAVASGTVATSQAKITGPVTVIIGGVSLASADVAYAGLSPGSISGLYQFNVRIPSTTADGDVPVVIQMGSLKTQDGGTIPVKR
ncbi:MAG: choice-of-anchor V domain-containing protein [Bryobacteraceae bacterium]